MVKTTGLSPLPHDIIFDILILLPAEFLHNHGRFVCKTWRNIIENPSFAKAHALLSKPGLFFQNSSPGARFSEVRNGKIQVAEYSKILAGKTIMASSSGVMLLESRSRGNTALYVANLVTNQLLELPQLSQPCHTFSVAYLPITGEIKVLCHASESRVYKPFVLTVGRNMAWTEIQTKQNIPPACLDCCKNSIFSLDGVIYYKVHCLYDDPKKLYAIDLAGETIHAIKLPAEIDLKCYKTISTGKSLSVIYQHPLARIDEAMKWNLKDFKTSEWVANGIVKIRINARLMMSLSPMTQMEICETFYYGNVCRFPVIVHRLGWWIEDNYQIWSSRGWLERVVRQYGSVQTSICKCLMHSQTLISW